MLGQKGRKKALQATVTGSQTGVTILITGKINLKPKLFRRDKEDYFILCKGRIYWETISMLNIHVPNIGALKLVKKILPDVKPQIIHNSVIVGGFNFPLSPIHRSSRQKINRKTLQLNDNINDMDSTDLYRAYHANTKNYSVSSVVHWTFSKMITY